MEDIDETKLEQTSAEQKNAEQSENITSETAKKNKNQKAKRRKPLPLRILLGSGIFLGSLIIMLSAWIVYSALDRTSPLKFIPQTYTALIHTDSIIDSAEPLLKLEAAENFLSESLPAAREPYMQARDFINGINPALKLIMKRRIDAALYIGETTEFVATVDLSYLSFATRLHPVAAKFLKIKNLTWNGNYFEFKAGENSIYIKMYKNLVVATMSKKLLGQILLEYKNRIITQEETTELEKDRSSRIKVVAPSAKLLQMAAFGNYFSDSPENLLGKTSLTSITLDISNDEIDFDLKVPVEDFNSETELFRLLKTKSEASRLRTKFTSDTQFYTMLNLCTLQEMKELFFPFINLTTNIDTIWKKANGLSKAMFSLTLEDILFSWTGKEIATFGIEGSSDPVFAIEIKDEAKRKEVFDILGKSLLVNTNTSLIVNGMRLPCFELPVFLTTLLSTFGISLPRPYYIVKDGFIYFSLAPQNLSAVFTHINKNYVLSRNEHWNRISEKANGLTSLELYYNLKRSLPFFLDNSSPVSKFLKLYAIGRFDISVIDNSIQAGLHAVSVPQDETGQLAGFPKQIGKPKDFHLIADNSENPQIVYWIENETIVKSLDLKSLEQKEFNAKSKCSIASANGKLGKDKKLWIATEEGRIYLLNSKHECTEGFPVDTNMKITAPGSAFEKQFAVPAEGGILITADANGKTEKILINEDANFKTAPAVFENYMALYSRGFEGEIYILKNGKCINRDNPMTIDGIGFGSPSISKVNGKLMTAFITQSGSFYLFEDGKLLKDSPVETDSIFYTNVVFLDNSWFALSEGAQLYKISAEGNFEIIQIPGTDSAKDGIICTGGSGDYRGVFVSGDSNTVYGFAPDMELLLSFPLAGRGTPVFADVNKNGKNNCMILSISREINSWRLQ